MKTALRSVLISTCMIFGLSACHNEKAISLDESDYHFEEFWLNLPLDSMSVNSSTRFQSFNLPGSDIEYLAFHNLISSSIKIYDLDNPQRPKHSIIFETSNSPNSIGGALSFFEILNKDSVLVYADFSGGLITLTDWEGNKINSFNLPIDKFLETNPFPAFNSSAPIFQPEADVLLFPYSISKSIDKKGKPPLFQFDMQSGQLRFGLKSLAFYQDINIDRIGGNEFFKASMTYDPDKNSYALILPLDDRVFSISPELELLRIDTLPDSDFKEFQPLERPANKYKSDDKRYLYHRYGNSRYASIIYDPWKRVYYRVLIPGFEKRQIDQIVNEGVFMSIPFKVSVFDQNFNKLLDYEVNDEALSYQEFFVSSQGLSFKEQIIVDEDIMRFKTLRLASKQYTKKP